MNTVKYGGITLAAFVGFVVAWTALRLPVSTMDGGMRFALELLWFVLGIGIAGVVIPLFMAHRSGTPFNEASSRTGVIAGIALYLAAIFLEVAVFRSWYLILTVNPDEAVRLKYAFISLPLSLAVSVFSFVLIPRSLRGAADNLLTTVLAPILVPGLTLCVVMYVLAGADGSRVPLYMALIGAMAGLGHLLTKKFFLSFLAVFLAVHANTLSGNLYRELGWHVALAGLVIAAAGLFIGWIEDRDGPEAAQC